MAACAPSTAKRPPRSTSTRTPRAFIVLAAVIPTLKEEEKAQIMAWLVEAREFAMDAENSNKKHAAFGKYKGRINNYLSKRGYDLVKERKAWYERIKARGGKI